MVIKLPAGIFYSDLNIFIYVSYVILPNRLLVNFIHLQF